MHFDQTLLSKQNLSAVKMLLCAGTVQLARTSYLLQRRADALGNIACCPSEQAALMFRRCENIDLKLKKIPSDIEFLQVFAENNFTPKFLNCGSEI